MKTISPRLTVALCASLAAVFPGTAFAHCSWRHPGHCITEAPVIGGVASDVGDAIGGAVEDVGDVLEDVAEDVGDVLEDVLDAGEDVADGVVHIVNELGQEGEELICSVVGREPGQGCGVSGGIAYDDQGNVVLTDGEGTASDVSEPEDHADILGWSADIAMSDWEAEQAGADGQRYVIGGVLLAPIGTFRPESITWFTDLPSAPTASGAIRQDSHGYALVGGRRSRNGGYGLHRGTDYVTHPGEAVLSPFDGVVVDVRPMSNGVFDLIEIREATGITARILYSQGTVERGATVARGQVVGTAQDLHVANGYPATVTNHVHVAYLTPERHALAPNNRYAVLEQDGGVAALCTGDNRRCLAPESY